ncbi:MAG: caspase family protein [Parachlamydiaceae bacterium]
MTKCFFLFLSFFWFLWFDNAIYGKTIHAILVADTIHEIQHVTQPDLYRWQSEVRLIATHSKMSLKEKIFAGQEFNKEKIKGYLKHLKIEKDDSIIFYFSGHGYRTLSKKTPWPFLTFEYYKHGLDVQWVVNTIRSKQPQFSLVMSDCCNNFMENGMFGTETKHVIVNLKETAPEYSGYPQLFNNAKGCVVISSCSEGQFSYGSDLGGLYTQCFFASLKKELKEKKPSWKRLLERANGLIGHIQRPICEVYR